MNYRTRDGDVLDLICHKHYGPNGWSLEAVLATNPGLAAKGAVLPAGLTIELPQATKAEVVSGGVRLWD